MSHLDIKRGRQPNDPAAGYLLDLFEEVRTANTHTISAHLADTGFSDITHYGLLALGLTAIKGTSPVDAAKALGMTKEAAREITEMLVKHGYLQFPESVHEHGRPRAAITDRGIAAISSGQAGVMAARWTDFPFRAADIVISTMPKSGTTWIQTICALLIFQTPELPAPLAELSPFMDWIGHRRSQIYAELASQKHRRFIKTHQPLAVMPGESPATFIVMARDPLDMALSSYYHWRLVDRVINSQQSSQPEDPRQWLLDEIDALETPLRERDGFLTRAFRHLCGAWPRRGEPNIMLLHYESLSADLEGEMRRLASRLGIVVPESTWPSLVKAATFEQMRAAANRLRPLRELDELADGQTEFFRHGASGDGRALLTKAEFARYCDLAARLAPPSLLAWLLRNNEESPLNANGANRDKKSNDGSE
jgi:aryl sulfotransferase